MKNANPLKSFVPAWDGILALIKNEPNARIHLLAATCAILLGLLFRIDKSEWLAIILAIALVIACEALNSALEVFADIIEPNFHPKIKLLKDMGAAAVLVSAIGAAIIGISIFTPKILGLI